MNNPQEQRSDTAKPYLTPNGNLIIPHNAEAKYRYWQGGQSVLELTARIVPEERSISSMANRSK